MSRNTLRLLLLLISFCLPLIAFADAAASNPRVQLNTSMGSIVLEIDAANAPLTADNFLKYVESGHYNGTIFHRVIKDFMVQGGGYDTDYKKKSTRDEIQNEADNGLKNDRGTIAMARTSAPHSASAQFFINHKDNDFLNHSGKTSRGWGYAVFGKVVEGMDSVDSIARSATGRGGPFRTDAPLTQVVIESAEILR